MGEATTQRCGVASKDDVTQQYNAMTQRKNFIAYDIVRQDANRQFST